MGMADSRTSLDLPARQVLPEPLLSSRSSGEETEQRKKGLGTGSSLVEAQAAAGLRLKHNKKQEADVKERFVGGI